LRRAFSKDTYVLLYQISHGLAASRDVLEMFSFSAAPVTMDTPGRVREKQASEELKDRKQEPPEEPQEPKPK
jgi:hypothetical protein